MVASFDSQYLHCGESDEIAAPQFGQLRVCASIDIGQLSTAKPRIATKKSRTKALNQLMDFPFQDPRSGCKHKVMLSPRFAGLTLCHSLCLNLRYYGSTLCVGLPD